VQNRFRLVVGRQATLIKPVISEQELFAMWEILRMRLDGKRLDWSVFVEGLNRIKDAQKKFAQENGVGYVDVEVAVPKDLDHFLDHVHYTDEGEKAVGKAFAKGLLADSEVIRILGRTRSSEPVTSL
jgi:hypothetical protein